MNYDQARRYLLLRPEAFEDFPFGPDIAVMKIKGKMFATLSRGEQFASMNLKCDPWEAQILRDIFTGVLPGYHMNKQHWNTVLLDGTVPGPEIERMIDRSYGLVVKGLKKVQREALVLAYGEREVFR
ncbi:MAG: MmcQ/YjbR family DNA-binding protein [Halieaceae bacterium]|nr:MmcQ/YjbR family DNA-binding protein [Halieaceae bacterium]